MIYGKFYPAMAKEHGSLGKKMMFKIFICLNDEYVIFCSCCCLGSMIKDLDNLITALYNFYAA